MKLYHIGSLKSSAEDMERRWNAYNEECRRVEVNISNIFTYVILIL